MEVKDILKQKRKSLGMTCEEVGAKVGVSPSTISRWERGDIANMKRDKIVKLAEVLEISPAVIMGWEDRTESVPSYYLDNEDREMVEFIHKNPEYRVLFDTSRKVRNEDIQFVKEMMDRMIRSYDDTGY